MRKVEHLSYEERMRELRLFGLEKMRLRGILSVSINAHEQKGDKIFSAVFRDRTRGNGHKLGKKIQSEHQKLQSGLTLEWAAQRGGGVSVLGIM